MKKYIFSFLLVLTLIIIGCCGNNKNALKITSHKETLTTKISGSFTVSVCELIYVFYTEKMCPRILLLLQNIKVLNHLLCLWVKKSEVD